MVTIGNHALEKVDEYEYLGHKGQSDSRNHQTTYRFHLGDVWQAQLHSPETMHRYKPQEEVITFVRLRMFLSQKNVENEK